ncbi:hypothetical protein AB3N59_15080 [Leptospira sp. WS92.C1]
MAISTKNTETILEQRAQNAAKVFSMKDGSVQSQVMITILLKLGVAVLNAHHGILAQPQSGQAGMYSASSIMFGMDQVPLKIFLIAHLSNAIQALPLASIAAQTARNVTERIEAIWEMSRRKCPTPGNDGSKSNPSFLTW